MIILYLIVIAFLICFPSDTADTALRAIHIWGTGIVPVLFPYMIFSRLLCKSIQMLHLPAGPAAAALGLLGGSPSGASVIAANAERLHAKSLAPLCALTGTVSPMFILGTMQAWTNDPLLCRRLLLCHWFSALASLLIARSLSGYSRSSPQVQERLDIPFNPIGQSIDAILQVGGNIICFSVLAGILGKLLVFFPAFQPYIHAFLEISGGIHALCQTSLPEGIKNTLLSAALGFGGLSILSQNYAQLKPLGITMHQLLRFAVLRAATSAFFMTAVQLLYAII